MQIFSNHVVTMSTDNLTTHVQGLNKINKLITSNKACLVTQTARINDLLLTVIEEIYSNSEKDFVAETNCWTFLHNYCSSFGKLVALTKDDSKVIINHLKGFIQVKESVVQLQDKSLVPKKRKRHQNAAAEEVDKREPDSETWKLHHSALKALNSLLIAINEDMDEFDFKEVSHLVVAQLMDIYCKQDNLVGVYTVLELREDLLRIFRTLNLLPKFVKLRPLQVALSIFTNALNWEQDSDLKTFCRESLLVIQLIVRPVIPVEIAVHSFDKLAMDVEDGSGDIDVADDKDDDFVDANQDVDMRDDAVDVNGHVKEAEEEKTLPKDEPKDVSKVVEVAKEEEKAKEVETEVITINDDSQEAENEVIQPPVIDIAMSGSDEQIVLPRSTVIVAKTDDVVQCPSPRRSPRKHCKSSVIPTPGSSNYVTADESINSSQTLNASSVNDSVDINGGEVDIMAIIDELN